MRHKYKLEPEINASVARPSKRRPTPIGVVQVGTSQSCLHACLTRELTRVASGPLLGSVARARRHSIPNNNTPVDGSVWGGQIEDNQPRDSESMEARARTGQSRDGVWVLSAWAWTNDMDDEDDGRVVVCTFFVLAWPGRCWLAPG